MREEAAYKPVAQRESSERALKPSPARDQDKADVLREEFLNQVGQSWTKLDRARLKNDLVMMWLYLHTGVCNTFYNDITSNKVFRP